jgi:hypothetical protein
MGPIIADGSRKVAVRVFLARWLSRIQFADELGGRDVEAEQVDHGVPRHDRRAAQGSRTCACELLSFGDG